MPGENVCRGNKDPDLVARPARLVTHRGPRRMHAHWSTVLIAIGPHRVTVPVARSSQPVAIFPHLTVEGAQVAQALLPWLGTGDLRRTGRRFGHCTGRRRFSRKQRGRHGRAEACRHRAGQGCAFHVLSLLVAVPTWRRPGSLLPGPSPRYRAWIADRLSSCGLLPHALNGTLSFISGARSAPFAPAGLPALSSISRNGLMISIGIGKMMVEFCSAPISVSVCR